MDLNKLKGDVMSEPASNLTMQDALWVKKLMYNLINMTNQMSKDCEHWGKPGMEQPSTLIDMDVNALRESLNSWRSQMADRQKEMEEVIKYKEAEGERLPEGHNHYLLPDLETIRKKIDKAKEAKACIRCGQRLPEVK